MRQDVNQLSPRVIIWGGTGAAKEARPIIEYYGSKVVAVFDDTPGLSSPWAEVPIYCGYDAFLAWLKGQDRSQLGFCLAIGNPHGRVRLELHDKLIQLGLAPVSFAHPSAVIAADAVLGPGAQVLAGAIIDQEARIGRQCIISMGAIVTHEVEVAAGSEIGPGATVCGLVRLGVNVWVGAGAVVLPRLTVGNDALIGAGAVVTKDVTAGLTVVGNPARPLRKDV